MSLYTYKKGTSLDSVSTICSFILTPFNRCNLDWFASNCKKSWRCPFCSENGLLVRVTTFVDWTAKHQMKSGCQCLHHISVVNTNCSFHCRLSSFHSLSAHPCAHTPLHYLCAVLTTTKAVRKMRLQYNAFIEWRWQIDLHTHVNRFRLHTKSRQSCAAKKRLKPVCVYFFFIPSKSRPDTVKLELCMQFQNEYRLLRLIHEWSGFDINHWLCRFNEQQQMIHFHPNANHWQVHRKTSHGTNNCLIAISIYNHFEVIQLGRNQRQCYLPFSLLIIKLCNAWN